MSQPIIKKPLVKVFTRGSIFVRGSWRTRTAVHGFADRCLATRPRNRIPDILNRYLSIRQELSFNRCAKVNIFLISQAPSFFTFYLSRVILTCCISPPKGGLSFEILILSPVTVSNSRPTLSHIRLATCSSRWEGISISSFTIR